jgi:hypothetical protein
VWGPGRIAASQNRPRTKRTAQAPQKGGQMTRYGHPVSSPFRAFGKPRRFEGCQRDVPEAFFGGSLSADGWRASGRSNDICIGAV